MKSLFFLAIPLFFLALPLWPIDTGFSIKQKITAPLSTLKGSILSMAFTLSNISKKTRTVSQELLLPEGWKTVSSLERLELSPGARELCILGIYVSENAKAGIYTLVYRVNDKTDDGLLAEQSISVEVLPSLIIDLKLIGFPDTVIAGSDYSAQFLLCNLGNIRTDVDLDVKCGEGFTYDIPGLPSRKGIGLAMSEQKLIDIVVHTNADTRRTSQHHLEVIIRPASHAPVEGAVSSESEKPLARAVGYVEVIPLVTGERSLMRNLPVKLGLKGLVNLDKDGGMGGGEIDVDSKGSIDEEGYHNVDIHLEKRVDSNEDMLFNSSDRYSIAYATPAFTILAGDHAYSLSPLLDNYHFGRGIETAAFLGPLDVGAYYFKDIWSVGLDQSLAAFAEYRLANENFLNGYNYSIALNLLSQLRNDILIGIHQCYYPVKEISLDLDLASETDEYGLFHKALKFEGAGDHGWISYKVGAIYADPGFSGNYRDLYSISADLGFRFLDRHLFFQSLFYQNENNLSLNPFLPTAERTRFFQLYAGYIVPSFETQLAFFYQNIQHSDRFPSPAFDTNENNIKITTKQPFPFFTFSASAMLGFKFDNINTSTIFLYEYNAEIEWRTLKEMNCLFSFWYKGSTDPSTLGSYRLGFILNGQIKLPTMIFMLGIKNSYLFNETVLNTVGLDISAGFTYLFPNKQTLALSLLYYMAAKSDTDEKIFSFLVNYTVPFNIPLGPKASVCHVHGRVYDETSGKGREGIILRIGDSATATDADGIYTFYLTGSGKHFLTIDRHQIGDNMIPNMKMPVSIEIAAGEEKVIDIGVVRGTMVTGHVAVYRPKGQQGDFPLNENGKGEETFLEKSVGLSNILVEISLSDEKLLFLTDKQGEFVFDEVRPGMWTFRILSGNIPPYHYYEKEEVSFDVIPGEKREIVIRVLEEKRKIMFIQPTTTLVIESTTKEPDKSRDEKISIKPEIMPEKTTLPTGTPIPMVAPLPVGTPIPVETPIPAETPQKISWWMFRIPTQAPEPMPTQQKATWWMMLMPKK
jgi:hypothetical protein